MDKLKELVGLFRRQHFWFLSPVVLILATIGWYYASGKIDTDVGKHKTEIGGYFNQLKQIITKNVDEKGHPNPLWEEGMKEYIESRKANVTQAWTKKWERQANILKWPEGLSFKEKAEKLRPIESVDTAVNPLVNFELDEYKRFVKSELPKLAERIRSEWGATTTSVGSSRESRGPGERTRTYEGTTTTENESVIVTWNVQNQNEIEQMFDWGNLIPNTLQVLYAQENLWALSQIMDIIQETNGEARTRSAAPIKHIYSIHIGKDVLLQEFAVIRPAPPPSGEAVGSAEEGMSSEVTSGESTESSSGESSGESMGDGESTEKRNPHPAEGRYVNDNFKPIMTVDELKATADVAKRIPIRLRVHMDQRQINRLLVACANAPLTFEVRQLRFNPQDTGQSFSGSRRYEGGLSALTDNLKQLSDPTTFDRVVELYGIIYIFNPVNSALLNGEIVPAATESTPSQ
jgi:hypothetical protein